MQVCIFAQMEQMQPHTVQMSRGWLQKGTGKTNEDNSDTWFDLIDRNTDAGSRTGKRRYPCGGTCSGKKYQAS